jgi:hypothetical protein
MATNGASREHLVAGPKRQCTYGYVGSFEDAIKPILLLYLVGSAVGSIFLAVLCEDGTRPFVLSTTLHLIPEVFVWTHLIFPPATTTTTTIATLENNGNKNKKNRSSSSSPALSMLWTIRSVYLAGWLILCLGPINAATGKVGPVVAAVYMLMAGVSDTLGVWLGLLMMTRRSHHGARRLGVSFFVHGSAFHLAAYEVFCPHRSALGPPELAGFAWIILLVASTAAFMTLPSLFTEPLDLRDQAPTAREKCFLVAGVLTSLLTIPPLAAGGGTPDTSAFLANPTFLPRDPSIFFAYKTISPILSMIVTLRVLLAYVDAGLPILPLTHNRPQHHPPVVNNRHHNNNNNAIVGTKGM